MSTPTTQLRPKFDIRSNSVSQSHAAKISVRQLNFFYGRNQALHDISLELCERMVTAFIGPSGCGKTTFLRTLNRMNDVIAGTRVEGEVLIDGMLRAADVVQMLYRQRLAAYDQASLTRMLVRLRRQAVIGFREAPREPAA